MLLKLIKIRATPTGIYAELWRKDQTFGDIKLATVFVFKEHWLTELIYRAHIRPKGIYVHGKPVEIQWDDELLEATIITYLLEIQHSREEIYLDVCEPIPDLPGYPETDYHPDDYPEVIMDWDELVELGDKVNDQVII